MTHSHDSRSMLGSELRLQARAPPCGLSTRPGLLTVWPGRECPKNSYSRNREAEVFCQLSKGHTYNWHGNISAICYGCRQSQSLAGLKDLEKQSLPVHGKVARWHCKKCMWDGRYRRGNLRKTEFAVLFFTHNSDTPTATPHASLPSGRDASLSVSAFCSPVALKSLLIHLLQL